MSCPSTSGEIARAYRAACGAELEALKPGNVHVFAAGHGMTVADFARAAAASAPAIARTGAAVGERILDGLTASRAAVATNTNLGILLLAAPLAAAAELPPPGGLRTRLRRVLAGLTVADAEATFAAIRHAAPAGLGTAAEGDVGAPATLPLGAAMALARRRDLIARQYADGYGAIFGFGRRRLAAARARFGTSPWAVSALHLAFLAGFPDSHLRRTFGLGVARAVCSSAAPFERALLAAAAPEAMRAPLLAFDAELKSAGRNPGTTADLTVATLFAEALGGFR